MAVPLELRDHGIRVNQRNFSPKSAARQGFPFTHELQRSQQKLGDHEGRNTTGRCAPGPEALMTETALGQERKYE